MFVTRVDVLDAYLAASLGNEAAARLVRLVAKNLEHVGTTQPTPICLLCNHKLSDNHQPLAFVFVIPECDDPSLSICSGLCQRCSTLPDVANRAVNAMRSGIAPDARVLPKFDYQPGHA